MSSQPGNAPRAAWGPNHAAVKALFERASALAPAEAAALEAVFNGWGKAYERARDMGIARRPDAYWAARTAPRGLPDRARKAIMNAAGALVVRDLIDPGDFAELYGPWAHAIEGAPEPPALTPSMVPESDAEVLPRTPWRRPEAALPIPIAPPWLIDEIVTRFRSDYEIRFTRRTAVSKKPRHLSRILKLGPEQAF